VGEVGGVEEGEEVRLGGEDFAGRGGLVAGWRRGAGRKEGGEGHLRSCYFTVFGG
jgi:hypothetical protein